MISKVYRERDEARARAKAAKSHASFLGRELDSLRAKNHKLFTWAAGLRGRVKELEARYEKLKTVLAGYKKRSDLRKRRLGLQTERVNVLLKERAAWEAGCRNLEARYEEAIKDAARLSARDNEQAEKIAALEKERDEAKIRHMDVMVETGPKIAALTATLDAIDSNLRSVQGQLANAYLREDILTAIFAKKDEALKCAEIALVDAFGDKPEHYAIIAVREAIALTPETLRTEDAPSEASTLRPQSAGKPACLPSASDSALPAPEAAESLVWCKLGCSEFKHGVCVDCGAHAKPPEPSPKPCQCGNPILRWVHQQPPFQCGRVIEQ